MDQQLTVKIDAKGRICIPAEIKEVLGKLITSEPELKGKPKFATPEEMKSVWRTAKWRLA
jgi:DNA-binding transcriptional regulator/RsmH inhibitor MraZ